MRVESGDFGLDADVRLAVLERIDDLIGSLTAATRSISKIPQPAVGEAAAKMAHLFYITGHGWRRYLAASAPATAAGTAIHVALRDSVAPLVSQMGTILAARPATPVSHRSAMVFGLPCAVCSNDAVTLSRTTTSPVVPEQLVVSSLSPVTVFRPIAGSRMTDLLALLAAGNAEAVVKQLRDTQPDGCDAFCATCARLFCRDHYAIEAKWSGSWHEATFVTCPLGHEHEID